MARQVCPSPPKVAHGPARTRRPGFCRRHPHARGARGPTTHVMEEEILPGLHQSFCCRRAEIPAPLAPGPVRQHFPGVPEYPAGQPGQFGAGGLLRQGRGPRFAGETRRSAKGMELAKFFPDKNFASHSKKISFFARGFEGSDPASGTVSPCFLESASSISQENPGHIFCLITKKYL